MRPRRGATSLSGILPLDKPEGMTSHDVVAALRRASGEQRIGHAGTLDPMATGLLVTLVGRHARLEPYLSARDKTYEARIAFGSATDTEDADGEVTGTAPVPERLFDPAEAETVLAGFVGPRQQTPPAFSAIKVDGEVSHRRARAGAEVVLEPRPIEVFEAELMGLDAGAMTWDVRFRVSKGTYVRSLARDIGLAAGTLAHLSALRRTASGPLRVAEAHSLTDAESAAAEGHLAGLFADPLAALDLPSVEAPASDVANGRAIEAGPDAPADGTAAAVTVEGRFAGVYRRQGDRLRAECVVWSAS